ncbi:hypothetical protein GYMLUDRAFT_240725 [Collybiopsis luxurians FD-317 M1]|nr:hypothetical protein GYMLUDRAFT_240725 [Collybiopsis luxurians FD-317 M1]
MDSLALTKTFRRDTYPAISPYQPSLSQAGKTVFITGGGDGIGFEIARSFAKASASRIILFSRRSGVLENAASKLRDEFKNKGTLFIPWQGDLGDDSSIEGIWDYLHSQNIFVHVLVLNAVYTGPVWLADTLKIGKQELMKTFNANVGGNFLMLEKFVNQTLRPVGQQLNLINVSTAGVHITPPFYNPTSKAAFTGILGRIANERSVEDIQIISFHPGLMYSEGKAEYLNRASYSQWDKLELAGDFSVWASSPEAAWLHGRFTWANWDVEELKANAKFVTRVKEEKSFLKPGIAGLSSPTHEEWGSRLYV